jgi:transcription antitermination factor NusA-like protein
LYAEESSKALSSSDSAASAIAAPTAETVLKVTVPNSQAGALIGKGGCAIKMVRETSGAKIRISDNSGLDRIVRVTSFKNGNDLMTALHRS